MMRTTINLPEDIVEVIRSFADVKGISLGEDSLDFGAIGLSVLTDSTNPA